MTVTTRWLYKREVVLSYVYEYFLHIMLLVRVCAVCQTSQRPRQHVIADRVVKGGSGSYFTAGEKHFHNSCVLKK